MRASSPGRWSGGIVRLTIVLLIFGLAAVWLPAAVSADGMPVDPNAGPGKPGTNNGQGPGANKPGAGWPPTGTQPKGPIDDGSFAGTWYAFVDNTAFTLVIQQEGQLLKVAHTAVYDYGRRIDSSHGVVSMAGTVNGSLAYLEWKSSLSPENGRATLEYMPGRPVTLHRKIDDSPKKPETDSSTPPSSDVAYFLPASAYLMRK